MVKFIWAVSLTIVSSILPLSFEVKAQFVDDFSDGNFISDPPWAGEDIKFIVAGEVLALNAPAETGTAYLSTGSNAIENGYWEFLVKMDFNPSGSNFSRVYLMSDQPNLLGPLNGYFVLLGGADDEVSLYRQSGSTVTKIIDGLNGVLDTASVIVRVRVLREDEGHWSLYSDPGNLGLYNLEGRVVDDIHTSSLFFGIYCRYTSTRSKLFFFDDFIIEGNALSNAYPDAGYKDIIITEIFADPSPTVELPNAEFVEIYNRGTGPVKLSGWTISDGSTTGTLVGKTINAGAYLILISSSFSDSFLSYGDVLGVKGFPSLNNSGDAVILKSPKGILIDSIKYADSWYNNTEKKKGGWSLELIDVNNICGIQNNWIASEDARGGTPGTQNSVFGEKPDLTGPKLLAVMPITLDTVQLVFNENLAKENLDVKDFILTPSTNVISASFVPGHLAKINAIVTPNLAFKTLYTFSVRNLRDCNHNRIDENSSIEFALPEEADSLDVIINEVLFNPYLGGVDFVEIYNNSNKYIDLNDWSIGHWKNENFEDEETLTTENILLKPFSYKIISSDLILTMGHYPRGRSENGIESVLPSMNDTGGSIALINPQGDITDAFTFSEDYHSPFLRKREGVSLERASFNAPTNVQTNWKSASGTEGYATPGYQNSNALFASSLGDEDIKVEPEIFQPINGTPNFAQINFHFNQGGYIANANILDAQGRMIKKIANNEILGTEGFYRWDGDTDEGQQARIGYYVLWFEVFDSSGIVKTFRKRIVVAGRF